MSLHTIETEVTYRCNSRPIAQQKKELILPLPNNLFFCSKEKAVEFAC